MLLIFKKLINLIYRFCCWQTFRQFVRYGIIGSSSVLIDMVFLYVLTEVAGFWYMVSAVIATTTVVFFNFFMNRNWSFASNGLMRRQMVKYSMLLGFNYLYSIFGLYFFVEFFHLHYLMGKIIIALTMVTWNFALFKFVIYK